MSNKIWDSRRGWVRPNRGFTIYRKKPTEYSPSLEEMDAYENAPVYEHWTSLWSELFTNRDWKVGYTKKNNPVAKLLQSIKREKRFEKINKWLNRIPFVTVEVIE